MVTDAIPSFAPVQFVVSIPVTKLPPVVILNVCVTTHPSASVTLIEYAPAAKLVYVIAESGESISVSPLLKI